MSPQKTCSLILLALCTSGFAEIIPATWSSADGVAGTGTGTISANGVSLSSVGNAVIAPVDLTGPDYSFAPLTATEPVLSYSSNSQFTAQFAFPVTNLLTYVIFYRGANAGPATVVYSFNKRFTIVSGLAGVIKVGNTIVVGNAGFFSGIIRFPDTFKSLSLQTNATGNQLQAITFSIDDATPTVSATAVIHVPAGTKSTKIKGTAFAPIGIQKVEIKPPGKPYATAFGKEKWTSRSIRLTKAVTKLRVRATSSSGKRSSVVVVTVQRP